MDLFKILPEELIQVVIETLGRISKVSILVIADVNKFWYKIACMYALSNKIKKPLQCHEIASEGSLEVLEWAITNESKWNSWVCAYAAYNGHIHVLKWAKSNGYEWDSMICEYAACNGHLDIIKWARSEGCRWDSNTCDGAARNGYLDVLKWARSNGCPWDAATERLAKQWWPNIFG
jgi:hypothetical protein